MKSISCATTTEATLPASSLLLLMASSVKVAAGHIEGENNMKIRTTVKAGTATVKH